MPIAFDKTDPFKCFYVGLKLGKRHTSILVLAQLLSERFCAFICKMSKRIGIFFGFFKLFRVGEILGVKCFGGFFGKYFLLRGLYQLGFLSAVIFSVFSFKLCGFQTLKLGCELSQVFLCLLIFKLGFLFFSLCFSYYVKNFRVSFVFGLFDLFLCYRSGYHTENYKYDTEYSRRRL